MVLYIVGIAIVVGLAALLWRKYRSGEGWQREASFFVDLIAMGATALIVGVLAMAQLQSGPSSDPAASEEIAVRPTAIATIALPQEDVVGEAGEVGAEPESEAEEEATLTPEATVTPEEDEEGGEVEEGEPITTTETITATGTLTATEGAPTDAISDTLTVTTEPTGEATATPAETPTPEPTATASGTQEYVVKAGDRLGAIALAYGLTTEEIVAANPGLNPDSLSIGQRIIIPTSNPPREIPAPAATTAPPPARTYIVQEGDYLNTIAARFGVTAQQILAVNPGMDAENLQIGQVIRLP